MALGFTHLIELLPRHHVSGPFEQSDGIADRPGHLPAVTGNNLDSDMKRLGLHERLARRRLEDVGERNQPDEPKALFLIQRIFPLGRKGLVGDGQHPFSPLAGRGDPRHQALGTVGIDILRATQDFLRRPRTITARP